MEELKYKETSIKLEESIAGIVEGEANTLGLTPAEMLRFIIGTWTKNLMQQGPMGKMRSVQIAIPNMPGTTVGPPGATSGVPKTIDMDSVMPPDYRAVTLASRLMLKKQIDDGDFKCSNCMLALSWESFLEGKCQLCGAPIWPFGSSQPGGETK